MCTCIANSRQIPPATQRYIPTSVQRSDSNSSKDGAMVSAWLESFFQPTSELLPDVVDEDGGTTCSARNGTDGREGLVAGGQKLAGGRTGSVVMSSSNGYEAVPGNRASLLWPQRLQESSKPADESGGGNTELDNGQPVRSRWRERDCGRRWKSGVMASYGRDTEKDGVQRSEESTVMGIRIGRAQCISILSS
jgi:hypothetical protein